MNEEMRNEIINDMQITFDGTVAEYEIYLGNKAKEKEEQTNALIADQSVGEDQGDRSDR